MMHIRIFDLTKKNCTPLTVDEWIKRDFDLFEKKSGSKIVFEAYKQDYKLEKSIEHFNNTELLKHAELAPMIVGMPV